MRIVTLDSVDLKSQLRKYPTFVLSTTRIVQDKRLHRNKFDGKLFGQKVGVPGNREDPTEFRSGLLASFVTVTSNVSNLVMKKRDSVTARSLLVLDLVAGFWQICIRQ